LPALEVFLQIGCTFSDMPMTLTESNVFEYLQDRFPLAAGPAEAARRVEAAGDGNINWVRRVSTDESSFIVKQAGPALEKFPEYAVSPDRILEEARYFGTVARHDTESVCPAIHFVDADHHVIVLEDLGRAERLDAALRRGADTTEALCRIARFLGRIHAATQEPEVLLQFPDPARADGVLQLHFDHIFRLPFEPNEFPLSPAVRAAADEVAADEALLRRVAHTESASRVRTAVIHGDVQPTNILLTPRGAVLLDAEIAHGGAPSFDLGLLFAHVVLCCAAQQRLAETPAHVAPVWQAYVEADERGPLCSFGDVAAVAGVEMLRRTLGAARVPEVSDDAVALEAVRVGRQLLLDPPVEPMSLRGLV
jgi:5-methylthioribose kinase